jgi:hypothetical protein
MSCNSCNYAGVKSLSVQIDPTRTERVKMPEQPIRGKCGSEEEGWKQTKQAEGVQRNTGQ